jgi:hypothetical protein
MKLSRLVTTTLAALLIAVAIGGCLSAPRSSGSSGSEATDGSGAGALDGSSASSTTSGGGGGGGGVVVDGGSGGGGGGSAGRSTGTGATGSGAGASGSASSSQTTASTATTSGSGSSSSPSTTSGAGLGPAPPNMGTASSFVILAQTGITTTGTTHLTGDLGVSPIAGTSMTGFTLVMDGTNTFATSPLVTGKVYAADYASPTPAKLTQAISDMQTAAADAAGRTSPTASELGAGAIGGLTFQPGLYKWSTAVGIGSNLVLSGGPNDVWIFQVAQTLDVASGVQVTMAGGAQAKNVYWSVGEQVTLGTNSALKGNLITETAIVFNTGASLVGRALAGTAVTLDANSVTKAT